MVRLIQIQFRLARIAMIVVARFKLAPVEKATGIII